MKRSDIQLPPEMKFTLKPHEDGMLIQVDPKLESDVAIEALHRALGSALAGEYTLISVFVPNIKGKNAGMVRVISDSPVEPQDIASILSSVIDDIESDDGFKGEK
jgi:hypothetical protein